MRTLALVLLGLLGLASPAFAETLYIGQASAGFGDGASCANRRAISFFNGSNNWGSGLNLISPGDTVYLCGTITTKLTVQGSGTPGNVITISPAPSQTTTIDATGLTNGIFNFAGQDYVTLDGVTGDKVAGDTNYTLVFTNLAESSGNTYGVYSGDGSNNVKVLHVKFVWTSTSGSSDNTSGVYLHNVGGVGIELAYNWVTGTSAPNKHAMGLTSWTGPGVGTGTSFTSGSIIHHNYIEYLWHDGIRVDSNASVYNNYLAEIQGSGHSDGIICQSGRYCSVYNNTLVNGSELYLDNELALAQGPIRFYNNVSYNGGFGIELYTIGGGGSWNDVVIANNTFYNMIGSAIRGAAGSITNLVLLNNLFGSATGGYQHITGSGGATFSYASSTAFDYNDYGTGGTSPSIYNVSGSNLQLTGLRALSPARETNGRTGTPAYVNTGTGDFHLASGDTIARGAGVNLTSMYPFLTADKDGVQRPLTGPWNIGAYEGFSGSTANPPPAAPVNLVVQ